MSRNNYVDLVEGTFVEPGHDVAPHDKTEEWDFQHAKNRTIIRDKDGQFRAVDKAQSDAEPDTRSETRKRFDAWVDKVDPPKQSGAEPVGSGKITVQMAIERILRQIAELTDAVDRLQQREPVTFRDHEGRIRGLENLVASLVEKYAGKPE
jgi:hypothetical protein